MSLELAFARDFVGWRNDHPRGAILWPGCAPGEEHCVEWSWVAASCKSRVFWDRRERVDGAKTTLINHRTIKGGLALPAPPEHQVPERLGLGRRRVLQRFDVFGVGFADRASVRRHVTPCARAHPIVAEELVPDIVVVDRVPRELQSSR